MDVDFIYNIDSCLYDVCITDNNHSFVIDKLCSCDDWENAQFIVNVLKNHVFIDS